MRGRESRRAVADLLSGLALSSVPVADSLLPGRSPSRSELLLDLAEIIKRFCVRAALIPVSGVA
jgi:hypothetical protein